MISIRVPATTANLGAGFDCLGMALTLYNEIDAEETDGLEIHISGEGEQELPWNETNLVWRAARRVFERVGDGPRGARLWMRNAIPLESGLGSSAAATVGGLLLGNALVGEQLDQASLLDMAVQLEGHPDNVSPALLGGLVAAIQDAEGRTICRRIPIPSLTSVVLMPNARLPTAIARRALPSEVPFSDAVFNLGRLALTLVALQQGDYALLAQAMADRLHQPYRAALVPGLQAALDAAHTAGAAAAISGAGPAIIAFAADNLTHLRDTIAFAFAQANCDSRAWFLEVAEGAKAHLT